MAKLTRIVKKILLKDGSDREVRKSEPSSAPSVESIATHRLPQPMVDFSNLPSIDDTELRQRAAERARVKSLSKVSRKGSTIAKKSAATTEFKKNVIAPKVKGRAATSVAPPSSDKPIASATSGSTLDLAKEAVSTKPKAATGKSKPLSTTVDTKVIKPQSRGKRKREATKQMWRRKYDFANEAKRLVESFHQEDQHGVALGNVSGLKNELESIEEMLNRAVPAPRVVQKPSTKRMIRAKLRNKALLQAAMNSA
uniref:Ribosome biogenesis protein SLX9 n=1 Tax=Babesia bovis TaxID=5865 RepID=Q7Z0Z8_BABBO|nr:unknown [Babesia bovis]